MKALTPLRDLESKGGGLITYTLQCATDETFTDMEIDEVGLMETSFTCPEESPLSDGTYFWRVEAVENLRVTDGQIVLYTFREGSGTTVHDVSGVGAPLDLTVADAADVLWLPGGGLVLIMPTVISSSGPAAKVIDAATASDEIAIEAWITPADTVILGTHGPNRIVALSADPSPQGANFVLGQSPSPDAETSYDVRLRTT